MAAKLLALTDEDILLTYNEIMGYKLYWAAA